MKISRRNFCLLMAGACCTGVLAACGSSSSSTASSSAASASAAASGEVRDELIFVNYRDIRDLNPHLYAGEMYAQSILYDTLVSITANGYVENETAIQEALSRLIKNKTVLIIAHRMRTVAGADQVVVLSGGIVAEQGSPAELYARKGLYTHMVDLQSASQNWTI